MGPALQLRRVGDLLADLNRAYASDDQIAFDAALDDILRDRESMVLTGVRRLSDSLVAALARFRSDSRIANLAVRDIPDARLRLDHVLSMTEEAAHKTLDLIERSVPLTDETARGAQNLLTTLEERSHREIREFLTTACGSFETVRGNLTEVMLTQGFQDLTGQIIRGVKTLIGEVEVILAELARLTGAKADAVDDGPNIALEGPAVPGVTKNAVSSQDDIDDLMAGLGI